MSDPVLMSYYRHTDFRWSWGLNVQGGALGIELTLGQEWYCQSIVIEDVVLLGLARGKLRKEH